MEIRSFTVGALATNCYVVSCPHTLEAIIIDPGFDSKLDAQRVHRYILEKRLKPLYIVNTHGHPDHTCGNAEAKRWGNVKLLIHEADAYMLGASGEAYAQRLGFNCSSPQADLQLREGDVLSFGRVTFRVMHTPGHSPGSILLVGGLKVFSGDTLFAGSIGRTDLPGGSERDMTESLRRILSLPDESAIYPGHGPSTTLHREKRVNPFLSGL